MSQNISCKYIISKKLAYTMSNHFKHINVKDGSTDYFRLIDLNSLLLIKNQLLKSIEINY